MLGAPYAHPSHWTPVSGTSKSTTAPNSKQSQAPNGGRPNDARRAVRAPVALDSIIVSGNPNSTTPMAANVAHAPNLERIQPMNDESSVQKTSHSAAPVPASVVSTPMSTRAQFVRPLIANHSSAPNLERIQMPENASLEPMSPKSLPTQVSSKPAIPGLASTWSPTPVHVLKTFHEPSARPKPR